MVQKVMVINWRVCNGVSLKKSDQDSVDEMRLRVYSTETA